MTSSGAMTPSEFYAALGLAAADPDDSMVIAADRARGLTLRASAAPSSAFREQVAKTTFGSTGVRYRRLQVDAQLSRFCCPVFLELTRQGQPVGTYLLAAVSVDVGGDEAIGIYRALLTISDAEKGRSLGSWLAGQSLAWIEKVTADLNRPVLTWGCMDARNVASIKVLEGLGARSIGTLVSMMVYRQWPRTSAAIEAAGASQLQMLLRRSKSDCFATRRDCTPEGHYQAGGDQQEAVAATVYEVTLALQTMGGRWDALYRHLLRFAAPARRRFDPDNFRYLRFTDLVVNEGNADQWPDFLTGLLAQYHCHMAMFVLDPCSSEYRLLADAGLFGRFGRATRQEIRVMGQAWHCDPGLLQAVAASPLGLGPLDV